MFDLKEDPQGFVRLSIGGEIDHQEMRAGLEAFLACLKDDQKTDFLYTIEKFDFPGIAALGVEFGYLPLLIQSISKIGKVAVVADQAWLRTAADIEGWLIPGLTIETFEPQETEKAIAWLTGQNPT